MEITIDHVNHTFAVANDQSSMAISCRSNVRPLRLKSEKYYKCEVAELVLSLHLSRTNTEGTIDAAMIHILFEIEEIEPSPLQQNVIYTEK